ncbi:MAG: hypothetical protein P8Y67_12605 [Alphaproteobacteria bacterium]
MTAKTAKIIALQYDSTDAASSAKNQQLRHSQALNRSPAAICRLQNATA